MQLRVDRQPAGISGYTCAVGFVFHLRRVAYPCLKARQRDAYVIPKDALCNGSKDES